MNAFSRLVPRFPDWCQCETIVPNVVRNIVRVASFMDGSVLAVQVEDFGLPKSAVGTVGQTSNIFKVLSLIF